MARYQAVAGPAFQPSATQDWRTALNPSGMHPMAPVVTITDPHGTPQSMDLVSNIIFQILRPDQQAALPTPAPHQDPSLTLFHLVAAMSPEQSAQFQSLGLRIHGLPAFAAAAPVPSAPPAPPPTAMGVPLLPRGAPVWFGETLVTAQSVMSDSMSSTAASWTHVPEANQAPVPEEQDAAMKPPV